MKKTFLALAILISGCNFQNIDTKPDYSIPDNINSETQLSLKNLNLKPYNVKGKENDEKENIKSSFGYKMEKHEKIKIDQIVNSLNQRIDDKGTDSIKPDFSGSSDTDIALKGKFDPEMVLSKNYAFTNDSNLLQVSYVGELNPRTKVLIDNVLLDVISASKTEIKVRIKTQAIVDFYLKGLHQISVLFNDGDERVIRTDALIRIGDPVAPKSSLAPSIDEVKIIKAKDIYYDKESKGYAFKVAHEDEDDISKYKPDTPVDLKIKGKNFPMFYKFSYSTIDSKFCFAHSTAISKDALGNTIWESIIHIPNIKEFSKLKSHSISYSTPFGTSIKRF